MAVPAVPGRTVPFVPITGKFGYVQITTNTASNQLTNQKLNVARWSPTQASNMLPVSNFNTPQDGNGNPHEEVVPGLTSTEFSIGGVQDGGPFGYIPTGGDAVSGVMGYSSNSFFPFVGYVSNVGGEIVIDGVAALDIRIKCTGLCLNNNRNGGA